MPNDSGSSRWFAHFYATRWFDALLIGVMVGLLAAGATGHETLNARGLAIPIWVYFFGVLATLLYRAYQRRQRDN